MIAFIALIFPFQESPNDPLQKLLEDQGKGQLTRAFEARPILGKLDPEIRKVKLAWETVVDGRLMKVRVVLRKRGGIWSFKNLEAQPEPSKWKPQKGKKAARSPGQLWKDLLTAIDKKAYERIPNMVREKSRHKIDPKRVAKDLRKEEEKTNGHFLEALRLCPDIREGASSVSEIGMKYEYDSKDGEVSADIEFVKEAGEWKIKSIDIDVTKAQD